MKSLIVSSLFLAAAMFASAQSQVLQILEGLDYRPIEWSRVSDIKFTDNQFSQILEFYSNDSEPVYIEFNDSTFFTNGVSIPHIKITTEDFTEIDDKENFKKASFVLHGFGQYDDAEAEIDIRGRGNSTWAFPKKPYRLKFSNKISLCGLTKAKSYVLLANWDDPSFMEFVVATKMAQILEIPYTNNVIPVDLTLNNFYRGTYLLTNKPGINAGSVDIDEKNSIMWELDTYFDEDYKFHSTYYNLPVMVADPDITDELFNEWKADFAEMEKAVYNVNSADYIDLDVYARYLLVYDLCQNVELQHPKSVKLYKTKGDGEKYIFGPIWDFDGAMGYWISGQMFDLALIKNRITRHAFFQALEKDPLVREAYYRNWQKIKPQLQQILDYIDCYADVIRNSAYRDMEVWANGDFDSLVDKLKTWIEKRFEAVDNFDIIKQHLADNNSPISLN